ncbi:MAG TPA: hypothetical protein VK714_02110 [Myxococcota bacterium]|nr:hypothetical protein [Myxococcota bacterium]
MSTADATKALEEFRAAVERVQARRRRVRAGKPFAKSSRPDESVGAGPEFRAEAAPPMLERRGARSK